MTRVTIAEVARKAGVSIGTVSRVLNGHIPETRSDAVLRSEKIRKVARQLGYRPNSAARSMLKGEFGLCAVVTCGDPTLDWFPRFMMHGLHQGFEEAGQRMQFVDLPAERFDDPNYIPRIFAEAAVDGMAVHMVPAFSQSIIPAFEEHPVPTVWLNLKRKHRCVYPDDRGGAAMATRYLIERGCRKIGFLHQRTIDFMHFSEADRFGGFKDALKEAGLSSHRHFPEIDPNVPRLLQCNLDEAMEFLRRFPDVDGVLCYEVQEAISLVVAAERLGRKLGVDLHAVAFGIEETRKATGVPMPTAVIPFREVGLAASRMLTGMLALGQKDVPGFAVPFTEIVI
jgi:LacI family transcriptional regulator